MKAEILKELHENAKWITSITFNPHFTDAERRTELRKANKERRALEHAAQQEAGEAGRNGKACWHQSLIEIIEATHHYTAANVALATQ